MTVGLAGLCGSWACGGCLWLAFGVCLVFVLGRVLRCVYVLGAVVGLGRSKVVSGDLLRSWCLLGLVRR